MIEKAAQSTINLFENIFLVITKITEMGGQFLLSLFVTIAPTVAPLGPALLFGYNFYQASLHIGMNGRLAIVSAVAVGAALECAGIISTKVAVTWLNKNDKTKLTWALVIVFVYFVAGISTVFVDSESTELRLLTIITFVITIITYAASALYNDALKTEKVDARSYRIEEAIQLKNAEFELEEKRATAEHKRQLSLRKLELKHESNASKLPETFVQLSQPEQKVAGTGYRHWRTIPEEYKRKVGQMTVDEIMRENPQISRRTAINWLNNAKGEG